MVLSPAEMQRIMEATRKAKEQARRDAAKEEAKTAAPPKSTSLPSRPSSTPTSDTMKQTGKSAAKEVAKTTTKISTGSPIKIVKEESISAEMMGDRTFSVYKVTPSTGDVYYTVKEKGKIVPGYEKVADSGSIHKQLGEMVYGSKYDKPAEVPPSNIPIPKITKSVYDTDIKIEGRPKTSLPSYVDTTKKPLVDTGQVQQGTATPKQLGATSVLPGQEPTSQQQAFMTRAENVSMTEGEAKQAELGVGSFAGRGAKQYYIGKSETGEPLYAPRTEDAILYEMPGRVSPEVSGDISSTKSILQSNIEISKSNIEYLAGIDVTETKSRLVAAQTEWESILKMKPGEMVTLIEEGGETSYERDIAVQRYSEYISSLQTQLEDVNKLSEERSSLTKYEKSLSDLLGTEYTIGRQKELGYIIEKDKDVYNIRSPTTHETFEYVYGKDRKDILLGAVGSSDLFGIKTFASAIQYGITGDETVKLAKQEELERSALDISKGRELGGNVFEAVIKSPAVQTGAMFLAMEVGTPIVLSGATKVASSGLKIAYSGGAKVTTALAKYSEGLTPLGSKIFGGAIKTGTEIKTAGGIIAKTTGESLLKVGTTKIGQAAIVGQMYMALESPHLIEVAIKTPERFGSELAGSAGGWIVAGYAIKEGMTNWYRPTPMPVKPRGLEAGVSRPYTSVERFMVKGKAYKPDIQYIPNIRKDVVTETNKLFGIEERTITKQPSVKAISKTDTIAADTNKLLGIETKPAIEEPAIKAISQTKEVIKISYDVKTGTYTKEQIPIKATERPWTGKWEFKPPEKTVKTGKEVIAKQEPWGVDIKKKYEIKLRGETKQRLPEDQGRTLIYKEKELIYAPEKGEYFLGKRDVVKTAQFEPLTKAEIMKMKAAKSKMTPFEYKTLTPEEQATPKWMRRDKPPSPETWKKFEPTKEDLFNEDWQNALVEKKWRETKSGDVGKKQKQIPIQTNILETQEGGVIIFGKAKPKGIAEQYRLGEKGTVIKTGGKTKIPISSKYEIQTKVKSRQFEKPLPVDENIPKRMRRDKPPSPETWEKFEPTKEDLFNEDWQNALVEKKWRETKSMGVRVGKPKETVRQQQLDIKHEPPEFIKEGTVAGRRVTTRTPLKYYENIKETGLPDTPLNMEREISHVTILEKPKLKTETAYKTKYEGAEYKGKLETINRPLTEQEVKILSEAEEGVYVQRRDVFPAPRLGYATATKQDYKIRYDIKTDTTQKLERKEVEDLGLKLEGGQKEETKQKIGYMLGIKQIQKQEVSQVQVTKPAQKQIQRLRQEQVSEKALKIKYREIIKEEPLQIKKRIRRIRRILIPDIKEDQPAFMKAKKRKRAITEAPKIKIGEKDKGLRADWLSVTQSHARFGKATQPVLTKRVWGEAAKTGFMRVPTAEMRVGENKRNVFGNRKKGGRNVYI